MPDGDATPYILRRGASGADRLRALARSLATRTRALLRRAGLRRGMSCLDVGCGIGAVTKEIARIAGRGARIVGVDADEGFLEVARKDAERHRQSMTFVVGDATALDGLGDFDFVFARFLLSHLPRPEQGLTAMVRSARPGGIVVVEDVDFAGHFSHPASPAFDRYVAIYEAAARRRGNDPWLGRRLPELCREAGLESVAWRVESPAFSHGPGKRIATLTFEAIREPAIELGLIAPDEHEAVGAELEQFVSDPRTIVSLPRVFQAHGRRPHVDVAESV